jgi:hypothetical protein
MDNVGVVDVPVSVSGRIEGQIEIRENFFEKLLHG